MIADTLGVLLKYQDDISRIQGSKAQGVDRPGEGRAEGGRVSEMPSWVATPDPTGRLPENILLFARALREAGLPVGPGSVIDALAAVEAARIGDRADFYATLHAGPGEEARALDHLPPGLRYLLEKARLSSRSCSR